MNKMNIVLAVLALLVLVIIYKLHSREGLAAGPPVTQQGPGQVQPKAPAPTVPAAAKPKVLGKFVLTDVNGNDSNALILSVT
jgi:hypothetical protein